MPKDTIEALRHLRTGKLFILIDDSLDSVYSVVDASGKMTKLSAQLFAEDALFISDDDPAYQEFSNEQLDFLSEFNERAAASADVEKLRLSAIVKKPSPRTSTGGAKATRRKKEPVTRTAYYAAPVSWESSRLTFFRHKIQPLAPRQQFRIMVDGIGEFEMTKEEFSIAFNDVIMAPSYRNDGIYTYPEIPEKARRFLKQ